MRLFFTLSLAIALAGATAIAQSATTTIPATGGDITITAIQHASVQVEQALEVGDVAAHLDREEKVGRRLLDPARDRRLQRQAVERVVDLDGVEEGRVLLEPAAHRETLVDQIPPVRVVPA